MMLSVILHAMHVNENWPIVSTLYFGPFLCVTEILLVFQSDGSRPVCMEFSNMALNVSQITGDNSFKILGCKLSGPQDLFTFNLSNSLPIILAQNCIFGMLFSGIVCIGSGILSRGSLINTLAKYSEKTSALT